MRILCFICARGGSQGLPSKNILKLYGKPLIAWSIDQALASKYIDNVYISTDSDEIAKISSDYGAIIPFKRPDSLATSHSGKFDVFRHALTECEKLYSMEYDLYLDLDCTNPLRDTKDIDNIIEMYDRHHSQHIDGIFTVCNARKSPYFNLVEENKSGFLKISKPLDLPIIRRQDSPIVYEHVASMYALRPDYIKSAKNLLDGNLIGYNIDTPKSLDIDSEFDFRIIEYLMSTSGK